MTTQKRAVLYARVSSDDTGKDGRNLDGQIDMGREYATKRGYSIVAKLPEDDKGASGAEIDLPQLNRIRDMARAGEFDVLVVREIDRLSRNLAKQLIVEEELKRAGVSIEYVIGEYPDTPEGNFMKHVRGSVAEFEREKIRERMIRGRRLTVKGGSVLIHGHIPYGYLLHESDRKSQLTIHEPEARIVRMMFAWYVEGDETMQPLSLYAIKDKLNAMGVTSPNQTADHKLRARRVARGLSPETKRIRKRPINNKWSHGGISLMLSNETYAGIWRYGKKGYDRQKRKRIVNGKDNHLILEVPAIISRKLWEAAQARLKENRHSLRRTSRHNYLLGGRVICGCCHGKMSGTAREKTKTYLYYKCKRSQPSSETPNLCTMILHFPAEYVDSNVWQWIKSFLKDPKSLNRKLNLSRQERDKKNKPLYEQLKVADDLLAENQTQLDRVLDLYQIGKSKETKEAVSDRIERLRETVKGLEKERSTISAKLAAQTITAKQIEEIESFAAVMREEIDLADEDFEARRYLIARMHTAVELTLEDGEKIANASCLIGKKRLSVSSNSIDIDGGQTRTL